MDKTGICRKNKSVCRLIAAVLVLGILTGCGSSAVDDFATNEGYSGSDAAQSPDGDSGTDTGDSGEEIDPDAGIAKDEIKVGVLYISDPAEGSGYSYTHDLGIVGMQQNLGLSDAQIERKVVSDTDTEATRSAIKECIEDGCNIIFTTSWGYMQTTAELAEEYPQVYFSHGTGYMSNGRNFNNYFGRIYQPRYLSGIVAGMNTKSNKIGYVAAMGSDNSEVTGGIDAFALGVASVNEDAKIYVKVTNSWYDPVAEEAASRALLDMGCDVMAQHCDTPYPLTLAEEYGAYAVGYNSDMSKECPDTCLCSVVWNWSAYYTYAVQSVMDGTWNGENYYGGMADSVVDMTAVAAFAAEGTQEKVDEAIAAILAGTFNVFDGVMETNTGEVIGEEGKTLDDAVITGDIHWYYYNVVLAE